MTIMLNIVADSPEAIAEIFNQLQEQATRPLDVDITGDDITIGIDLTAVDPPASPEPDVELAMVDDALTTTDADVVDDNAVDDEAEVADDPEPAAEPDPPADDAANTPADDDVDEDYDALTCEEAIAKFLGANESAFTAAEIGAEIGHLFKQSTINVTLSRMVRTGSIVRPATGLYEAA